MPVTTPDLKIALRKRYEAPAYATLFEVPNATGGRGDRSCDAIVMGCWPSRGLDLIGFEFKVSRGDWRRELKNPDKADFFVRRCDRFYLATAPEVVLDSVEIPPAWGWLEWRGGKFIEKRPAPVNANPEHLDRLFLASLLRGSAGASKAECDVMLHSEREVLNAEFRGRVENAVARQTSNFEALKKTVAEFEAASGIAIADPWGGGAEMGKAVALVRKAGLVGNYGTVANLLAEIERMGERLRKALTEAGAEVKEPEHPLTPFVRSRKSPAAE